MRRHCLYNNIINHNRCSFIVISLFFSVALFLTSCQESLEERCEREAKAYTEKNCPAPVGDNITIDSLTFEESSHTLHYFYTLSKDADNVEIINKINPKKALLEIVKNATSLKAYKDNGYKFAYTYMSASQHGKILYDVTFTEKDYK